MCTHTHTQIGEWQLSISSQHHAVSLPACGSPNLFSKDVNVWSFLAKTMQPEPKYTHLIRMGVMESGWVGIRKKWGASKHWSFKGAENLLRNNVKFSPINGSTARIWTTRAADHIETQPSDWSRANDSNKLLFWSLNFTGHTCEIHPFSTFVEETLTAIILHCPTKQQPKNVLTFFSGLNLDFFFFFYFRVRWFRICGGRSASLAVAGLHAYKLCTRHTPERDSVSHSVQHAGIKSPFFVLSLCWAKHTHAHQHWYAPRIICVILYFHSSCANTVSFASELAALFISLRWMEISDAAFWVIRNPTFESKTTEKLKN